MPDCRPLPALRRGLWRCSALWLALALAARARIHRDRRGRRRRPSSASASAILIEPRPARCCSRDQTNRELPIASTTKMMTALVVLQHVHNLNTVFTADRLPPAPLDSQIGLSPASG